MKAARAAKAGVAYPGADPRRFGRVSGRQVLLAASLAIGLTAAAATAIWQFKDPDVSGTGEARPAVSLKTGQPRVEPIVVNYLVGSEAQARAVLADPSWMEDAEGGETNVQRNVLVLDGSLDEELVMSGFAEVNLVRGREGLNQVRVIDLR